MTRANWLAVGAGIVLGLIFLAAGLGKALSQTSSFVIFIFPEFLPTTLDELIFRWLPTIEIVIGVLLVTGVMARPVTCFALALTAAMIANNAIMLIQGLGDKPCNCFGEAERWVQLRVSIAGALYIDIVMLILGIMILFYYRGKFASIRPWFLRGD